MMDELTKSHKRTGYARVCVVISAVQDLQTIIPMDVDKHTQLKVEYKWVPSCCKFYKVFRHASFVCLPKSNASSTEQAQPSIVAQPYAGEGPNPAWPVGPHAIFW